MKYTVHSIKYDTDCEDVDLPDVLEIEIYEDIIDKEEIVEIISDRISDITGFCHKGFIIQELD